MGDKTGIQWTDASWNPIRGCTRVSEGCRKCYAEAVAARFSGPGQPYEGLATKTPKGPRWTGVVHQVGGLVADLPLRWKRPRRIFVNSMSDLFHEGVPDDWIDRIFAVMALAPQHQFQVLTKRPQRMLAWFQERWQPAPAITLSDGFVVPAETMGETRRSQVERACEPLLQAHRLADSSNDRLWTESGQCKAMQWEWPLPNVWLGVSVEEQATADERIPLLLATPAAVRFISAEPLLGPVDLSPWLWGPDQPCAECPKDEDCDCGWRTRRDLKMPGLDWVIAGGESGPGARPCDVAWIDELVAQCQAAKVPVFVKQLGARPFYRVRSDPNFSGTRAFPAKDRKGGNPDEWPVHLRVREMPA